MLSSLSGRQLHALTFHRDAHRTGVLHDFYALELENLFDRRRDIAVLTKHELRPPLDNRDLRPESSEDLSELERDVTAAQDEEVLGHVGQFQDPGVVQPRHVVEPREVGHARASARIDIDAVGGDALVTDADLALRLEATPGPEQRYVLRRRDPRHHPGVVPNGIHARSNRRVVDLDPIRLDAVFRCATRHMRDLGAGHECLRRRAPGVHAGAADAVSFDDRDRVSGL